jgi:hypothetical protein
VKPSRSWLTRKRLTRGFAGLAALVGFLVGVTSLVDFADQRLDTEEPPPPEIDARVSGVSLTTVREPYEHYLRATNQSLARLPKADRREKGLVFAARVRFKGGEGDPYVLRMSVFDSRTSRPLPDYVFDVAEFTPGAQDHGREWPVWLPYPPRPGTFFVRATILDAKEQPVDERDSKRFRVRRVPAIPG